MKREEARQIYKEIKFLYPLFNKNDDKDMAVLWLDRLELGDYQRTKEKLLDYSIRSSYPPTLADVIETEYIHRDDGMAEQIKQAEALVEKEKANPEIAARRKQKLDDMRKKLGAYYDG